METETNENKGPDDPNAPFNENTEAQERERLSKREREINSPSQPAEEHLITEADNVGNDPAEDYEDPDQVPEEIDPINHPGNFQKNPEEESDEESKNS